MQKELVLNNKDILAMNLVNYFITEENYNPVVIHGINDEIWLENMESEYKIIRIITKYIHNNEQLGYDNFKLKMMVKKLKLKTFSFKMNVLNIYTSLGDTVNLQDEKGISSILVNKISDINKNKIIEVFPNIVEKTNHKEKGIDLFVKMTENLNKTNMEKEKKANKIFSKKLPLMTYIIMSICILAFALMHIVGNGSTDNVTLLLFGANLNVLTTSGQYYRLLTSMFLHIGIMHLLLNMYSLYIIGPQIESFFGKWKFLIIYLISGISGSILSIAFNHNVISAGASGAIFGLFGSMLYFGYYYRAYLGNALRSQVTMIIFINLMLGFMLTGVDNAAHIGGLIGGILTTMTLGIEDDRHNKFSINNLIVLLIYLAFIVYLAFIR